MFAVIAFFVGAVYGWVKAGKAGGNRMDKAQYAIAHALAFFLLVLVITVVADWLNWV